MAGGRPTERFADMGVSDFSIIPGRDDASSLRNVESIVDRELPQLSSR